MTTHNKFGFIEELTVDSQKYSGNMLPAVAERGHK
jgi:hypothetical protein